MSETPKSASYYAEMLGSSTEAQTKPEQNLADAALAGADVTIDSTEPVRPGVVRVKTSAPVIIENPSDLMRSKAASHVGNQDPIKL